MSSLNGHRADTANGVPSHAQPMDKAARTKRFEDVFDLIAEELLGYMRGEGMPGEAVEWYKKVSSQPYWPFC